MSMKNSPLWGTKNNVIDKTIRLSSAGLLLVIVLLYILFPDLAVSINRLMEMTISGSEKGLMMTYYQGGDYAWALAGLNHLIQLSSLVMDKSAVWSGIHNFFSPVSAKVIWALSGLAGIWILYGIGSILRSLLMKSTFVTGLGIKFAEVLKKDDGNRKIPLDKCCRLTGSLLTLGLAAVGQGFFLLGFLLLGVLGFDYRKICLFALIGFLLN